jgi:hypothetical protein
VIYLSFTLPVDNTEPEGEAAIWVLCGRMTGWKRRKDKVRESTKKGKRREEHNNFFFKFPIILTLQAGT